jgi:hypothetical protein
VTRITVNDAVCEALFASPLQPSDALTAETVANAIASTVRRVGLAGCAGHLAQEYGDHPDEATVRMRWIRQLTGELGDCICPPTAVPVIAAAAASSAQALCEAA